MMDWAWERGKKFIQFYPFEVIKFYFFSRAIMQYLVDKYAKDNSLYPKDLKARALVDARLNFDCGTLWPRIISVFVSILLLNPENIFDRIFFSLREKLLRKEN